MNFVGTAVTPQLETVAGASVQVVVSDPDGNATGPHDVAETMDGSEHTGRYPYTFVGNKTGMWTVQFTATGAVTLVRLYFVRFATPRPPLASTGDYLTYPGAAIVDDAHRETILTALIAVSEAVRDYAEPTWTTTPEWLVRAICRVVAEESNKDPQLRSMTVGEYSETYAVAATGRQDLLPSWLTDMIDRQRQRAGKGLGTIRTTRGHEDCGRIWLSDGYGGDPILYDQREPW